MLNSKRPNRNHFDLVRTSRTEGRHFCRSAEVSNDLSGLNLGRISRLWGFDLSLFWTVDTMVQPEFEFAYEGREVGCFDEAICPHSEVSTGMCPIVESGGEHLPIVAMTAFAIKGDRERCLAADMNEYQGKPLTMPESRRVPETVCPPGIAPLVFDESAALERLDGDRDLLKQVGAMLLEDAPRMRSDIGEAIAAGDAVRLEKTAHKLKGALIPFCSLETFEAAKSLEELGRSHELGPADEKCHELGQHLDRLIAKITELIAGDEPRASSIAINGHATQDQNPPLPVAH